MYVCMLFWMLLCNRSCVFLPQNTASERPKERTITNRRVFVCFLYTLENVWLDVGLYVASNFLCLLLCSGLAQFSPHIFVVVDFFFSFCYNIECGCWVKWMLWSFVLKVYYYQYIFFYIDAVGLYSECIE